jgi:hypothetical protein
MSVQVYQTAVRVCRIEVVCIAGPISGQVSLRDGSQAAVSVGKNGSFSFENGPFSVENGPFSVENGPFSVENNL